MLLLHITNGIESYKINNYYGQLIKLGYVEIDKNFKYKLTDKGKIKINNLIKMVDKQYEM